jgi:hypothetical protein
MLKTMQHVMTNM